MTDIDRDELFARAEDESAFPPRWLTEGAARIKLAEPFKVGSDIHSFAMAFNAYRQKQADNEALRRLLEEAEAERDEMWSDRSKLTEWLLNERDRALRVVEALRPHIISRVVRMYQGGVFQPSAGRAPSMIAFGHNGRLRRMTNLPEA